MPTYEDVRALHKIPILKIYSFLISRFKHLKLGNTSTCYLNQRAKYQMSLQNISSFHCNMNIQHNTTLRLGKASARVSALELVSHGQVTFGIFLSSSLNGDRAIVRVL